MGAAHYSNFRPSGVSIVASGASASPSVWRRTRFGGSVSMAAAAGASSAGAGVGGGRRASVSMAAAAGAAGTGASVSMAVGCSAAAAGSGAGAASGAGASVSMAAGGAGSGRGAAPGASCGAAALLAAAAPGALLSASAAGGALVAGAGGRAAARASVVLHRFAVLWTCAHTCKRATIRILRRDCASCDLSRTTRVLQFLHAELLFLRCCRLQYRPIAVSSRQSSVAASRQRFKDLNLRDDRETRETRMRHDGVGRIETAPFRRVIAQGAAPRGSPGMLVSLQALAISSFARRALSRHQCNIAAPSNPATPLAAPKLAATRKPRHAPSRRARAGRQHGRYPRAPLRVRAG